MCLMSPKHRADGWKLAKHAAQVTAGALAVVLLGGAVWSVTAADPPVVTFDYPTAGQPPATTTLPDPPPVPPQPLPPPAAAVGVSVAPRAPEPVLVTVEAPPPPPVVVRVPVAVPVAQPPETVVVTAPPEPPPVEVYEPPVKQPRRDKYDYDRQQQRQREQARPVYETQQPDQPACVFCGGLIDRESGGGSHNDYQDGGDR